MYKGYLKGSGKHAATKFKKGESELLTLEEAQELHEYVGLLEDGIVMVDCDDYKQSQKLIEIVQAKNIKCSILETKHGHHFYFDGSNLTTNKIKWYTSLGIMCDYKLGTRNTPDPLKIDGVERTWLVEYDNLDELPKWLYPMTRKTNQIGELAEGDGRNQSLFNYILTLQSEGMSKDEIRETIRIINEFILAEPVTDEELNVILRDEAFMKESFFIKGNFQHHKFSQFLVKEENIININDTLYVFSEGIYRRGDLEIERIIYNHLNQLTSMKRGEVIKTLKIIAPRKKESEPHFIACKNGILNIKTGELEEFSPEIILTNQIPVNYVKDAYYKETDNVLNRLSCNDSNLRLAMEEIFAYSIYRKSFLRKSFILTGSGFNGKSTFLKMLRAFLGEENTSSLELRELDERFKTSMLEDKLANIGDDISSLRIKDTSIYKKLVSGEKITVERKGTDVYDMYSYAKLIFSANEVPYIDDNSKGLLSRLIFLPFLAEFTPQDDDYNPFIDNLVLSQESLEYLLQLALSALERLLTNNQFTTSNHMSLVFEEYKISNNPVLGFLEDINPRIENESTADIYSHYAIWCAENDYSPQTRNKFVKEIKVYLKMTTKNARIKNRVLKVFVKDERL
ncbi:DNA primase [Listeria booriae]|uniref:DNA primase family protein n=1 Tax=Listeria booriae TaxID=1552123 RepID=UPI00164D36EB|nr:DNA primase family protein [Listeria booriae]MBC6165743.1 DNA primase [Listeria booriae]